MGTWGTGISSNDTFADVRGEFLDLYDEGAEMDHISRRLIERNQETLSDPDDANNFWFALAMTQWECGHLDDALLGRVSSIVETGADLEVWRRLDASESDVKKRENVLSRFVEKLKLENPKPRRRKRKIIKLPPFEKGTCLSFKLDSGNYGGAIILEAKPMNGFGINLVAVTRINQSTIPKIEDFMSADLMLLNFVTYEDEPEVGWKYNIGFKKEKHLFEVIGQIGVFKEYDPGDYSTPFSRYGGQWSSLIEVASLQFESEKIKPKPKRTIKMSKLIGRSAWRFW